MSVRKDVIIMKTTEKELTKAIIIKRFVEIYSNQKRILVMYYIYQILDSSVDGIMPTL